MVATLETAAKAAAAAKPAAAKPSAPASKPGQRSSARRGSGGDVQEEQVVPLALQDAPTLGEALDVLMDDE